MKKKGGKKGLSQLERRLKKGKTERGKPLS